MGNIVSWFLIGRSRSRNVLRHSIGIVVSLTIISASTTISTTTFTTSFMLSVFDAEGLGFRWVVFDDPIFGGKHGTAMGEMTMAWVFGPAANANLGIVYHELLDDVMADILRRINCRACLLVLL